MDVIQKSIDRKRKVVATICDADKRNTILMFLGEEDTQYLSPTLEDFENNEEADKNEIIKNNDAQLQES